MCRNIKTLFNFDPPATHAEIHASALQFVRKLSGFNSPSQANAEAFNRAVSEVSDSARRLLASLQTNAAPRDREVEAEKARERSRARFGQGVDSSAQPSAAGLRGRRLLNQISQSAEFKALRKPPNSLSRQGPVSLAAL